MKLKAPPGVGDPCVAGVTIEARNGVHEVEPEVGALLIECFGFIEIAPGAVAPEKARIAAPARRAKPTVRKA